jgi:aspartate kinase
MSYIVVKLGGSVCEGPSSAPALARIVASYREPVVFVLSALKGVTDRILAFSSSEASRSADTARSLAQSLKKQYAAFAAAFSPGEQHSAGLEEGLSLLAEEFVATALGGGGDRLARLASFGERFSALAFSAALAPRLSDAGRVSLPVAFPEDLGLSASAPEGAYDDAGCENPAAAWPALERALALWGRLAVPGFYGILPDGGVALYGRGGTDYSAVALAAAGGALSCDLYKDSAALRSADPAFVDGTRAVPRLSYGEATDLSASGAKVLHPRTAGLAERYGITLRIVSLAGEQGSVVCANIDGKARAKPKAIALGHPYGEAAQAGLGRNPRNEELRALSIVGEGIALASIYAVQAMKALEGQGIPARSIHFDPSGRKLALLVPEAQGVLALRALHAAFFGAGRVS